MIYVCWQMYGCRYGELYVVSQKWESGPQPIWPPGMGLSSQRTTFPSQLLSLQQLMDIQEDQKIVFFYLLAATMKNPKILNIFFLFFRIHDTGPSHISKHIGQKLF